MSSRQVEYLSESERETIMHSIKMGAMSMTPTLKRLLEIDLAYKDLAEREGVWGKVND